MDLIDRQAAIDALQEEINKGIPPFDNTIGAIRCGVRLARNIIEDLPSVQPRKGKWVGHKDYPGLAYLCSECNHFTTVKSNYCPNCGVSMSEGEQHG